MVNVNKQTLNGEGKVIHERTMRFTEHIWKTMQNMEWGKSVNWIRLADDPAIDVAAVAAAAEATAEVPAEDSSEESTSDEGGDPPAEAPAEEVVNVKLSKKEVDAKYSDAELEKALNVEAGSLSRNKLIKRYYNAQ